MSMDLYYAWREQLDSADLLLWVSYSALGWLIRRFGWCNHAGLVIKLDHFRGLEERRWTLEYLEHGGELNLLSDKLEKYKGQLWWYRLKPQFNDRRDRVAAWAFLNKGKDYDYKTLFRLAVAAVSVDAKKLVCSEYAYFSVRSVGIVEEQKKVPKPWDLPALGAWQKGIKIYDSKIQGRVV